MEIVKDYHLIPKCQRRFLNNLNAKIDYFNEAVEFYKNNPSRYETVLKNTDLWIEVYIEHIPQLQSFRDYVRSKLKELKIELYPEFLYKPEHNHFKDSVNIYFDELVESLNL